MNQLAGGIGKALVCTATGMIVAIPALMFHRYFRGRIAGYMVDMEHEAIQLLDALDATPRATRGAPAPHAPPHGRPDRACASATTAPRTIRRSTWSR